MNKIILTTSVLIVAVFTVAYLYFSNLTLGSDNNDNALKLIPNDAALIFEFKNDKSIYEIFSDYKVFDAVLGSQKKEEFTALKSMLFSSNQVSQNTLGQTIFLSFHPQDTDSIAILWIMPLPKSLDYNDVAEALKENTAIVYKETAIGKNTVVEAYIKSLSKIFYLQINQNTISGSFSKKTLGNSLDPKNVKIGTQLIEEINQANKQNQNSPARVFVNFRSSIPFLSKFFKTKLNGNFSLLNNFSAIATLNMNFKSDALMFNGITEPDTIKQNYINLFLNQKPVKNPIKRIVPDNTANFTAYGLSSYDMFHKDLLSLHKVRNHLKKLNLTLAQIRDETGIDPDRDIKKYWGNEFISFQLSTQEKFGAIQLTNGRQMGFFMEPLSSEYSENIRHVDYPGLFYYYFGDAFKAFNKPFFTIVDNQMIVSNSPNSLQRYLEKYSNNLLHVDKEFIKFDQLVANNSNISIFVHIRNSQSNIKSDLRPSYARIFESDAYGLKNFYGLSYQWTNEGDHFFTNFYAGYKQAEAIDTAFVP